MRASRRLATANLTPPALIAFALGALVALASCGGDERETQTPVLSRTVIETRPLMEVVEIEGATVTRLLVQEEQGHGWLWLGCHRGEPGSERNGSFIRFTESQEFNAENRPSRPWGDTPHVTGFGVGGAPDSYGVILDWTWDRKARAFLLNGFGLFDLLASSDLLAIKMRIGGRTIDHRYDLRAAHDSSIWETIRTCRR